MSRHHVVRLDVPAAIGTTSCSACRSSDRSGGDVRPTASSVPRCARRRRPDTRVSAVGQAAVPLGDHDRRDGLAVVEQPLQLADLGRLGRLGQEGGVVVLGDLAELARRTARRTPPTTSQTTTAARAAASAAILFFFFFFFGDVEMSERGNVCVCVCVCDGARMFLRPPRPPDSPPEPKSRPPPPLASTISA